MVYDSTKYNREWRQNNRDKMSIINKRHYWTHHKERRLSARRSFQKVRESLFDLLGHKCVHCGFEDKRALQFDHINGNGNAEVKEFKSNGSMLRYYRDNPTIALIKLQVLCANCNWIKKDENREVVKFTYHEYD